MHCLIEPSQENCRYFSSQLLGLAIAQTVRMISINLSSIRKRGSVILRPIYDGVSDFGLPPTRNLRRQAAETRRLDFGCQHAMFRTYTKTWLGLTGFRPLRLWLANAGLDDSASSGRWSGLEENGWRNDR